MYSEFENPIFYFFDRAASIFPELFIDLLLKSDKKLLKQETVWLLLMANFNLKKMQDCKEKLTEKMQTES